MAEYFAKPRYRNCNFVYHSETQCNLFVGKKGRCVFSVLEFVIFQKTTCSMSIQTDASEPVSYTGCVLTWHGL